MVINKILFAENLNNSDNFLCIDGKFSMTEEYDHQEKAIVIFDNMNDWLWSRKCRDSLFLAK